MTGHGRVLVVWCPDWAVVAALAEAADAGGDGAGDVRCPAAVLADNRVEVCNGAARDEGVRRGQRRRDAQARCPEVRLLAANPDRDARHFEQVLALVEELRPGVAPLRPGLMAVPAPARFYGGEREAAAVVAERLVAAGVWDCRFGVADDLFTAERAARAAPVQESVVVDPGAGADFLRPLPVGVLEDDGVEGDELAGLLRRLGLTTLGDFADLGPGEVANRFGAYGADVWRRVSGHSASLLGSRRPPDDLDREVVFEPPLDSSEAVCFSVRTTAERFVAGLADRQLVATAVRIEATYDEFSGAAAGGGISARTWLHPRCFSSRDLVDRVHWQLQGEASGVRSRRDSGRVRAPIERVRFLPETVEPAGDHAEGLWGGGAEEQVVRGVARVQSMIGYDAVRVPVLQGGRSAADRQALVPWGERSRGLRPRERPWPGRIPGPPPTRVFSPPRDAEVVEESGRAVAVTRRGVVTGAPVRFRVDRTWSPVAGWSGPWPIDEGWWLGETVSTPGDGPAARFQMVGVDGLAWLLVWSRSGWCAEAAYD